MELHHQRNENHPGRGLIDSSRRTLRRDFPAWAPRSDARLTLLNKFHNILKSAELALAFIGGYLLDPRWWEEHHDPASLDTLDVIITEFSQFSKIAFFHQFFGAVESSFRIFLRALNPKAAKHATAEFRSVYVSLLTTELPELSHSIGLLDLLRLSRNTVHNNGMVFSADGEDATVAWQGRKYAFLQGRHVEFVTWEFAFDRVRDLVALAVPVVRHPRLSHFENLRDPGADDGG